MIYSLKLTKELIEKPALDVLMCRLKGAVAVEVFKSFISSECNQIEEQLMNTYVYNLRSATVAANRGVFMLVHLFHCHSSNLLAFLTIRWNMFHQNTLDISVPSSTRRSANIGRKCTLKHVLALVQYPN